MVQGVRGRVTTAGLCSHNGNTCETCSVCHMEGSGQLMFKNCRGKWFAARKHKKANGQKSELPKHSKDNPNTHQCQGLLSSRQSHWTSPGWRLECLNEHSACGCFSHQGGGSQ